MFHRSILQTMHWQFRGCLEVGWVSLEICSWAHNWTSDGIFASSCQNSCTKTWASGNVVKLKSMLWEHHWRTLWFLLHSQDFQGTLEKRWFHWYQKQNSHWHSQGHDFFNLWLPPAPGCVSLCVSGLEKSPLISQEQLREIIISATRFSPRRNLELTGMALSVCYSLPLMHTSLLNPLFLE